MLQIDFGLGFNCKLMLEISGVTLSDVQIYSQGSNIVYVETGDIDENEGSFILSKIQTANMVRH